jgi:8-oxo-dGTP diphosphatase
VDVDPSVGQGTDRYLRAFGGRLYNYKRNVSALILYKADGTMLLQHRTKDAPTFPDHWSLFGGGIEEGETPEQAVRREALEELGYQLASPRLFTVQQIADEKMHVFVERYNGRPLILQEGQAMGWFLPSATKDLLMVDAERTIIEALGETLNPRASGS